MRIFRSFSGILIFGAILAHLLLTATLFSSILMYVEQSYKDQFIDNVRTTSNMLALQSTHYLNEENKSISEFLDELLLSGSMTFAEIRLQNETVYLPNEIANIDIPIQEDLYFSQHDDSTYFILASLHTDDGDRQGKMTFGFDETLVQEHIDTAYARGIYLAAGYFIFIIILILVFIPRLTYSLRLLGIAAENISSGNNDEHLNIKTRIDEFKSLINSLERMRQSISDQHKQSEKKEIYITEIMNRMADAMIIMDKNMVIQSMNASAEKIFGYKSSDAIGKTFDKLLSPCTPNSNCENCEKLPIESHMSPSNENSSLECI